jgi:hypothetical protein
MDNDFLELTENCIAENFMPAREFYDQLKKDFCGMTV